jgi:hypothetical protein
MPGSGGTLGTAVAEAAVALAEPTACSCGQELDCCRGEHCPRCGRDLRD